VILQETKLTSTFRSIKSQVNPKRLNNMKEEDYQSQPVPETTIVSTVSVVQGWTGKPQRWRRVPVLDNALNGMSETQSMMYIYQFS